MLKGCKVGDTTHKVHLDGYNLVPYLKGEVKESPRKEMLYWSDDGDLMALRYGNWKAVFKEQRAESFAGLVGADGRSARAEDLQPAQRSVREGGPRTPSTTTTGCCGECSCSSRPRGSWPQWIQSFKEFPPSQKPASFSVDQVMEKLTAAGQKNH